MTEAEHRSRVQCIFHESMKVILEPLKEAGKSGVRMKDGKGDIRLVFPVLASYVADYSEQCLVTCTKYGTCHKCRQVANWLGDNKASPPRTQRWTLGILDDAKKQSKGSARSFHQYCSDEEVAGNVFSPFWKDFPFTDIHLAITSDVLHQLYQGVFKHVVEWCQAILGEKTLDQRIRVLPNGHGLRQFKKGISNLSQISGSQRKNMAKILMGCIHDIMAPSGVKAVKALLDFIYLAQYPTHDEITLEYMQDSLEEFHKHKDYFVNVGCREHIHIPKFHSLMHYIQAIELLGTTDNYNTELFKRLHIDFARHGWRASNLSDKFPQMIAWLSRLEKILAFSNSLSNGSHSATTLGIAPSAISTSTTSGSSGSSGLSASSTSTFRTILSSTFKNPSKRIPKSLAKYPNYPKRTISQVEQLHNAPEFGRHLKQYLNTFSIQPISARSLYHAILPDLFTIDIYNMFHFQPEALQDDNEEETDIVKAMPISQSHPNGRFDTVVVMVSEEAESTSLEGLACSFPSINNPSSSFSRNSNWKGESYFHTSSKIAGTRIWKCCSFPVAQKSPCIHRVVYPSRDDRKQGSWYV